MAHFAKVIDNKVVQIIVADPEYMKNGFVDTSPGLWLQVSYNTRRGVHYGPDGKPDGGVALRLNYPAIGSTYDPTRDVFYEPQPHASWILREEDGSWHPPIAYPKTSPLACQWDENKKNWAIIPAIKEDATAAEISAAEKAIADAKLLPVFTPEPTNKPEPSAEEKEILAKIFTG